MSRFLSQLCSCINKRRFPDEGAARQQVEQQRRRYGQQMRAYFCKYCNGWHLTSRKER